MLTRPPEFDLTDPDAEMVGTCQTCRTVAHCRRYQCVLMDDGFGGKALHVGCSKVVGAKDGVDKLCGTRVRVSPEEQA